MQQTLAQVIVVFVPASIASLVFGMLFSWTSPSIPILISKEGGYGFTLEECSYLTVIPHVSIIFCSMFYTKLIDVIGRKYAVLLIGIPQIVSLFLIAFARNIYVFYVARAVGGIADTGVFTAMPTYIGEIATPKVRGSWGNFMTFAMYAGGALINLVGGYTSIQTTALITISLSILFLCTFIFVPESPYYFLMKGRKEEARKALVALRRTDNVQAELLQLESDVKRQMSESGTWKDLFLIHSNRKALMAGIFLRWAQQLSGIAVFEVYTQYIFEQAGGSYTAIESSIIFQCELTIGNFLASFVLDKIGRKPAMAYSSLCCSVVTGVVTVYLYISYAHPDVNLSNFRWVPLAGMITYGAFFSFGIGIVPTLMLGELFSTSIKGKGLMVLLISFGISVMLTTKLFQVMTVNFGMFSPFALFSLCSLLSAFFAYFFVPETKGKTLEEIQISLQGNKKEQTPPEA